MLCTFVSLFGCGDTDETRDGEDAVAGAPPAASMQDPPTATPGTGQEGRANRDVVLEPEPPQDPREGTVQEGDSLSRILQRAGLDPQQIHRLTVALQEVMDPAHIKVGQAYHLDVDEQGPALFTFERSALEHVVVRRTDEGAWVAESVEVPSEVAEVSLGASIQSSLWEALTSRGEHPSLIALLVDVFAYDIDFFTETHPGDTFKVLVEKQSVGGEFVRYRRILAAEYAGKVGTYRVYWWQPEGADGGRYVDDEGRGVARTLLKTPLKYVRVSSKFNPKRMHPVLHRVKGHQGVDYAAPTGTPIWAAADGRIVFRGPKGGAGNMVILSHEGGLVTLYMHLSKFADGQRTGTKVRAKEVIGYVGQTGLATGPHLHFGVRSGGRYVDPQSVKQRRKPGVKRAHRGQFRRYRERQLERLASVAVQ